MRWAAARSSSAIPSAGWWRQHLAARRRVAGLVLVASPGPAGLGPSLWQLSSKAPDVLAMLLAAQAGAGALIGLEAVRRALFTEETPLEWVAQVAVRPDPESPLALLDGLTWDLPAWFLVRRAPVLAILGDRDAFVPVTDLWAAALAYGAETELVRGLRPRPAARPALEEPGLADQRLAGRAAHWRRRAAAGRRGRMKAIALAPEIR